jgi:hypothetical protein
MRVLNMLILAFDVILHLAVRFVVGLIFGWW